MKYIIQIDPKQNQTNKVAISNVDYSIVTRWNTRSETWQLDFLDSKNIMLRSGVLVKSSGYCIKLPDDTVLKFILQGDSANPVSFEDFGDRVVIGFDDLTP